VPARRRRTWGLLEAGGTGPLAGHDRPVALSVAMLDGRQKRLAARLGGRERNTLGVGRGADLLDVFQRQLSTEAGGLERLVDHPLAVAV
jgi:hypothetical protein